MSNPYAQIVDLANYGLPATALGTLTPVQMQVALDTAAGKVDSYIGNRYPVPLPGPIPAVVTWATCALAASSLLTVRGRNPQSAADRTIDDEAVKAMAWLVDVQHQRAHLVGVASANESQIAQPVVFSSSVVSMASGATAPNRGW